MPLKRGLISSCGSRFIMRGEICKIMFTRSTGSDKKSAHSNTAINGNSLAHLTKRPQTLGAALAKSSAYVMGHSVFSWL